MLITTSLNVCVGAEIESIFDFLLLDLYKTKKEQRARLYVQMHVNMYNGIKSDMC